MPTFFTTFPAGYGKLSKAMSGRLKAKGMVAGMPDILVLHPRSYNSSTVIGLELKVKGNSTSAAQRNTHALLLTAGVRTYLVRSLNDVIKALENASIPYRNIELQQVA